MSCMSRIRCVMDIFTKWPAPSRHPIAARRALRRLAQMLEDVLHSATLTLHRASWRGRTRAFLAARHARARTHALLSSTWCGGCVREVRVAASMMRSPVPGAEHQLDEVVDGLAALTISMICAAASAGTISSMECAPMTSSGLGGVVQEFVTWTRSVVGTTYSRGRSYQDQVLAHDCQTDQCDVCRCSMILLYLFETVISL